MVMICDGKEEIVIWDSMKWVCFFFSNNSMGLMLCQFVDVVQVGDQICVQCQEDGILCFVQIFVVQSVLIFFDLKDGVICLLVGGFFFEQSNYNCVIQVKCQLGFSFKLFIYSVVLDNGFIVVSLVNDVLIVFVDEYLDKVW